MRDAEACGNAALEARRFGISRQGSDNRKHCLREASEHGLINKEPVREDLRATLAAREESYDFSTICRTVS